MSAHKPAFFINMNEEWRERAVCKHHDSELWFAQDHHSQAKAIAVCQTCPVRNECLEFALEHDERGVWGGQSERGRRRIISKRSAFQHGTIEGFASEMRSGGIPCEKCMAAATNVETIRDANLALLLVALRSLQAS